MHDFALFLVLEDVISSDVLLRSLCRKQTIMK
jgi:hypothetical protein